MSLLNDVLMCRKYCNFKIAYFLCSLLVSLFLGIMTFLCLMCRTFICVKHAQRIERVSIAKYMKKEGHVSL